MKITDADGKRPVCSVTVAFPTPSGKFHIGHALGQVVGDVLIKYYRLKGSETFFPLGIHATGQDIHRILHQIDPRNDEEEKADQRKPASWYQKYYGLESVVDSILQKSSEEEKISIVLDFFKQSYLSDLKGINCGVNDEAFFTTADREFQRFTQWTIRQLDKKGYIIRKSSLRPYCLQCDDIKAIEHDFSEVTPVGNVDLNNVRIQDGTVIFFKDKDGRIVPAYTTKAETVYGVTNLFFSKRGTYVESYTDEGKRFVVEQAAVKKLETQLGKKLHNPVVLARDDLESMVLSSPGSERKVVMLPADFVELDMGTGFVMSVPSHDPFDYQALQKDHPSLLKDLVTVIVDQDGRNVTVQQKLAAHIDKLAEFKERLYKDQNNGFMSEVAGRFASLPVPEARERIKDHFAASGNGIKYGELVGGTFMCRLHPDEPIILKDVEEYNINYGDTGWQDKTIRLVSKLKTFPTSYKNELPDIIRSRKARPCERKDTRNIGTPSPFREGYKIQALADSNIYMEYYVLAKYVNRGELTAAAMSDELLDFVMLSKGSADNTSRKTGLDARLVREIRDDIERTYPLTANIAGYEHKDVHFTFSIFNHSAIIPELFPRELILTSHLKLEGEKMSKSRGNIIYLEDAINNARARFDSAGMPSEASTDTVRFFLMYYQFLDEDFDWSDKNFNEIGIRKMGKFISRTRSAAQQAGDGSDQQWSKADSWLESKLNLAIKYVTDCYEARRFRTASIAITDELPSVLNRYLNYKAVIEKRQPNRKLVETFLSSQLKMMYPVTPVIANALHREIFCSEIRDWPGAEMQAVNREVVAELDYQFDRKGFEKGLYGTLQNKIGIAIGKKRLKDGFDIVVRTEFERQLLEKSRRLAKGYAYNIRVDNKIEEPKIVSANYVF
ncbi:MAG: class I tRNA ligase family protein [Candidatus Woesearchaeota archaeon]